MQTHTTGKKLLFEDNESIGATAKNGRSDAGVLPTVDADYLEMFLPYSHVMVV